MSTTDLEYWIAELRHSDYERRKRAAQAIPGWGSEATPQLMILLERDKSPVARVRAAEILGQLADPRALLPLSRVLESELDPDIRRAVREALIALEELPVAQQAEALLPALSSLAPEQDRTLALERLVRFYKRLAPEDRQHLSLTVKQTAVPETEPWHERFALAVTRLELPKEAPASPKEAPAPPYVPLPSDSKALVELLSHADYATRTAATAKLANFGEEALPALEQGLHAGLITRTRCIEALGKIRNAKAVPILVEARRVYPSLTGEIDSALHQLVGVLTEAPQPEYFGLYSRLVRDFRQAVPPLAIAALQAIVILARQQPERLHRTVLPLLKTSLSWPYTALNPSLVQLGRELDTLTEAFKDLPIPAALSENARDLPLPSENQKD